MKKANKEIEFLEELKIRFSNMRDNFEKNSIIGTTITNEEEYVVEEQNNKNNEYVIITEEEYTKEELEELKRIKDLEERGNTIINEEELIVKQDKPKLLIRK